MLSKTYVFLERNLLYRREFSEREVVLAILSDDNSTWWYNMNPS